MTVYKRRLIPIVDGAFQFKYTALIMGVAAVVSAALGYFLLDAYTEMNSLIEISNEIGDQMNSDDARRVFILVIGFLGAEVLVLGVLGLIITHRVCGPIFVLHKHLATIGAGTYPTLRPLRAGDEFRETFEVFSRTVAVLKDRDQKDVESLKSIRAVVESKGGERATLDLLDQLISERAQRLSESKTAG